MRKILLIISALAVVCVALAVSVTDVKGDMVRRKARAYYLEGARLEAGERHAEAYEMYRKALALDSSYSEASYTVGQMRLAMAADTLASRAEVERSIAMLRQYVEDYPADFFENQIYAYICNQAGHNDEAIRILQRIDSMYPKRTQILMMLADVQIRSHRTKDAMQTLDIYESREGNSEFLAKTKVLYMLGVGDSIAAQAEADKLVRQNPRSAGAWVLKGKVLEMSDRLDSALSCYLRAEELSPNQGAVKLELARVNLGKGDTTAYENKISEALLSEDIELKQKMNVLGDVVRRMDMASGDTLRTDRLFDATVRQYPHESELLGMAASYHFARKNLELALEEASYAIDLEPTNSDYYAQKMLMEAYSGRYKDALNTLHVAEKYGATDMRILELGLECAGLVPDTVEANRLGTVLLRVINQELSINSVPEREVLRKLTAEQASEASGVLTTLGDMYYQLNDTLKAYDCYERALSIDPLNYLALNNYAYFLAKGDGDLEKALEMSVKSLEGDENSPTYLDTFAFILYKSGRYEEALEYQNLSVDNAEKKQSASDELYLHLGDIYFALGDKTNAVEAWRKALELNPNSEELRIKLKKATK